MGKHPWKVSKHDLVDGETAGLEAELNRLSEDGYDIVELLPLSSPAAGEPHSVVVIARNYDGDLRPAAVLKEAEAIASERAED